MAELELNKREETIMQEAFMTGRIYNSLGEWETPHEIQIKLKENCAKALQRGNIPLEHLVIKADSQAVLLAENDIEILKNMLMDRVLSMVKRLNGGEYVGDTERENSKELSLKLLNIIEKIESKQSL